MKAEEVETRLLAPLVIVYAASVFVSVVMSVMQVGPDGEVTLLVGWHATVKICLFGTAWLVGSAFFLARNLQPHDVYKIYYMVVGMSVNWHCIAM